MSFLVKRYAWSLYFLTLPFLKPLSEFFKPEKEKTQNISAAVILTLAIGIMVFVKMPLSQFIDMSWGKYCTVSGCSPEAAEFMIQSSINNEKGDLLTFYDWGGWLIWNYPQIKPSIDGRMHLWRDESGYSGFNEYYPIEQNLVDIDETEYNMVLMSPKKPVYDRLLELVDEGRWELAYEDKNAGVFVREKRRNPLEGVK